MNTLTAFAFLLTLGLAHSGPIDSNNNVLVITEEFFPESLVIYTGQHNIIKIFTPINSLNFDDSDDEDKEDNLYVFFVEGERDSEGNTEYKGLYALKNEQASKILDNGRDIAASNDDSKQVFFAASDGIYAYNIEKNTADKYGTIDENIVGIVKANVTDLFYILTSSNEVYKVTEEGTVKEKLDKIKNAKQIVLDSADNLYYANTDKQVYVYSDGEVTKIMGLPYNPSYLQLLSPPFLLEDSIPLVVGKKGYIAHANGTSVYKKLLLDVYPTAYSMEASLIQFYGYNKKIYLYNILEMAMKDDIEGVQSYLDDKKEEIQSIATKSRKSFHA